MVGETYRATESVSHVCHGRDIHIFVNRRILARAFKQYDLFVAYNFARVYGLLNFFKRSHAARYDHGLHLRSGIPDEGRVDKLR